MLDFPKLKSWLPFGACCSPITQHAPSKPWSFLRPEVWEPGSSRQPVFRATRMFAFQPTLNWGQGILPQPFCWKIISLRILKIMKSLQLCFIPRCVDMGNGFACVLTKGIPQGPWSQSFKPSKRGSQGADHHMIRWWLLFLGGCFVCVTAWVCVHHFPCQPVIQGSLSHALFLMFSMVGPMLHHGECGAGDSDLMWSEFWITGSCLLILLMTVKTTSAWDILGWIWSWGSGRICWFSWLATSRSVLFEHILPNLTLNFMAESMSPIKLHLWGSLRSANWRIWWIWRIWWSLWPVSQLGSLLC